LDEHISPLVARQITSQLPLDAVISMQEWEHGAYLGAADFEILEAAYVQGLTLVTYDLRTIATLIKSMGDAGTHHGGVVFKDRRTIAQQDIGTQVRSLAALPHREASADWTNKVIYLRAE